MRPTVCKLHVFLALLQDTINALTNQNTLMQSQVQNNSLNSSEEEGGRVSNNKVSSLPLLTIGLLTWN